jgi:hypothetical protein
VTAPASFETVRGAAFLLAVAAAQLVSNIRGPRDHLHRAPSGPVELLPGNAAVGRGIDE